MLMQCAPVATELQLLQLQRCERAHEIGLAKSKLPVQHDFHRLPVGDQTCFNIYEVTHECGTYRCFLGHIYHEEFGGEWDDQFGWTVTEYFGITEQERGEMFGTNFSCTRGWLPRLSILRQIIARKRAECGMS